MTISGDKRLVLDWTKAHDVFPLEKDLFQILPQLKNARQSLMAGTCKGADFTGWVNYIEDHGTKALADATKAAENISAHSDALIVVGIGGSLLGTRAVYNALTHSFAALNPQEFHRRPLLLWAGHHLASDEISELLDVLDLYSPSILVVSKSGGTTEPALAFKILKRYLEERFGHSEAQARVFAVTDPQDGTLLKIAKDNGYQHFPIPRNIGGRYSIFSQVGLLPLAVAGVDVAEFLEGGKQAAHDAKYEKNDSLETNPALCYAGIRNVLYQNDFWVESLCTWTPKLGGVAEWWKQLFGESDGKDGTGIFPASAQFTTDLHSMGQYFQEGKRGLFATHLKIQDEYSLVKGSMKRKTKIPSSSLKDGFDFLVNKDLSVVQNEAQQGTFLAHADGKVPTLTWEIPELSAYWLGYWMYTNMFACAIGGLARGINPFDQPGVEAYKNNMFALIGKPGHEEKETQIRARLERGQRLRSLGLSNRG
jgi:glucose-6-phosphate isomerase